MKDKEQSPFDSNVSFPEAMIERERGIFQSIDVDHQAKAVSIKVDYRDGSEYPVSHIAWDYTQPGGVDRDLVESLFNPALMVGKRSILIDSLAQKGTASEHYIRYVELFLAPIFSSEGDIKSHKLGFRDANFQYSPTDGLSVLEADRGTYKDASYFKALQDLLVGGVGVASPAQRGRNADPFSLTPRHISIGVEGVSPTINSKGSPMNVFDIYRAELEKVIFEDIKTPGQKIARSILRHP